MGTVVSKVRSLNLPLGKYLVTGGSALEVYGIREAGDIDLMITQDIFNKLRSEGWEVRVKPDRRIALYRDKFEAATDFKHGNYCPSPEDLLKSAVVVQGIPLIRLEELMKYKKELGRDKDTRDIQLIEEFLRSH